ncbi:SulP family inorganic anion transporter [Streptomyces sp. NPDC059783]|uniref:bifunctional SulP family inorganic anion transporter/carbonic anhydrase n=1 Tax=Streptomyces sp. NPDC059783 TaxID=3346944 RepID=UPI00366255E7
MSACVPTRHDHSSRSSRPPRSSGVKRPHSPPPHRGGRFRVTGSDLSASITVFLLAIPMSLGLAVAMDAPLEAGLISAAVGGIVAGLLGGTPLQVSGPSAGLTVVTAEFIQLYGWRTTCAITIGAGLLQILLGSLRTARNALAVSPAIVHGTLAGIGVAIALAQLHIVLGGSPHSSAVSNALHLPEQLARTGLAAPLIGALTVAVLVLWPRIPGRPGRIVRRLPAALAAVALATAVAAVAAPSIARVDLPSWRSHALPEIPQGPVLGLATAVFTMMLVASLESLLAAVAVDKLSAERNRDHTGPATAGTTDTAGTADTTDTPSTAAEADPAPLAAPSIMPPIRRSDLDRELRAQGVANIVSGGLGGLAVSGGAVRSSANVRAGATGRASTVLHGVWVLVATGLLVTALEWIPLAALGALVMVVGVQMVNLAHIRKVHKHREFLVYGATISGVLLFGVLKGVAIGGAVAVAMALHRLGRTRLSVSERDGRYLVVISGQLTFLAVPRLSRALGQVPQDASVTVELDGFFMDHAAYEMIQDWSNAHTAHGGRVTFGGRSGGRMAEPAAAAHSCCRPWTPWRNHHCHDRPEHVPITGAAASLQDAGAPLPAHLGAASEPSPAHAAATASDPARGTAPSPATGPVPNPDSGPASTAEATVPPATGFVPDHAAPSAHPHGGHRLASGLSSFQRNTAPLVREELARLAREGQRPSQLFITCADSRLVTSMITASGPGDLFTVRNIGNLVPTPGSEEGDHSVGAAIEYAVDVLGVESITICGHSGCGAMNALLDSRAPSADAPETPGSPALAETSLRRWLRHGFPSLERVASEDGNRARISSRTSADELEQLCLTNVVQQLDHLRAHPSVARRLAAGALQLHGMYFHVAEAQSYLLAEYDGGGTGGTGAGSGDGRDGVRRIPVFAPIAPADPEGSPTGAGLLSTPTLPADPGRPDDPDHPDHPDDPGRPAGWADPAGPAELAHSGA